MLPDSLHDAIDTAVLAAFGLIGALTILIVAQRLVVDRLREIARTRIERLRPLVHRALEIKPAILPLFRALWMTDRPLVGRALLLLSLDLRGEDATALARVHRLIGRTDALVHRLGSPSALRRAQAVADLGLMRDPTLLPHLLRASYDRDLRVRLCAVDALAELGTSEALGVLVPRLQDPEPTVVLRAREALSSAGRPVGRELVRYLEVAPDARARAAAADVAGALHLLEAQPVLERLARAPDAHLRERAVLALGAIGDARSAPAVLPLLDDEVPAVRSAAVRALGELGAQAAVPALRRVLERASGELQLEAARALARSGPAGLDALLAASEAAAPPARRTARYLLERVAVAGVRA